jgi:hypothetical protein
MDHCGGKAIFYGAASHFSQLWSIEVLRLSSRADHPFSHNPKDLSGFLRFVFFLHFLYIRCN